MAKSIYRGVFDATKSYPIYSIVNSSEARDSVLMISVQEVPVGSDITDANYWITYNVANVNMLGASSGMTPEEVQEMIEDYVGLIEDLDFEAEDIVDAINYLGEVIVANDKCFKVIPDETTETELIDAIQANKLCYLSVVETEDDNIEGMNCIMGLGVSADALDTHTYYFYNSQATDDTANSVGFVGIKLVPNENNVLTINDYLNFNVLSKVTDGDVDSESATSGQVLTADGSGGASWETPTEQVQANWNETDTDSKAYILNKPTIPSAVTVDDAMSTTSENPVQNKVITDYIKPVFGLPSSPSAPTYDYTFSNPIPFHTPTANEKLLSCFAFATRYSNPVYIEVLFDIPSSATVEVGIGRKSNNHLYIYVKSDTLISNKTYTIYVYNNTGGTYSGGSTGTRGYNVTTESLNQYVELFDIFTTDNYISTFGNINVQLGNSLTTEDYTGIVETPYMNVTINGDPILTPWETIVNDVNTLKSAGYLTSVTDGDVDSESATSGQVLTADGSGGASWASPTSVTVDSAMSSTSVNPVQNKVITNYLSPLITPPFDSTLSTINYTTSDGKLPPTSDMSSYDGVINIGMNYTWSGYSLGRVEIGIKVTTGDVNNLIFVFATHNRKLLIGAYTKDGTSTTITYTVFCAWYTQSGTPFAQSPTRTTSFTHNITGSPMPWYNMGELSDTYQTITDDNIAIFNEINTLPAILLPGMTSTWSYQQVTFNNAVIEDGWKRMSDRIATLENRVASNVPQSAESSYPTVSEFNALLTALKNAGLMTPDSTP